MDSQTVVLPPREPNKELYLIGFRLDPTAEGPQFYMVMGSDGVDDRPLTRGGRVLLFAKATRAARAVAECDNGFREVRPVPGELELLCDVGGALHVANQQAQDSDGLLFELIAVFDDTLRAVQLSPPAEFAAALAGVAQRLTESLDFASYLEHSGTSRGTLEDALLWCVGAVMAKSSWLE